jgi:hypothetical protein
MTTLTLSPQLSGFDTPPAGLDIVGIYHAQGGRRCASHNVCGEQLVAGSIVCFKKRIWFCKLQGDLVPCVDVFVVTNGKKGCKVGYLTRDTVSRYADYYDEKCAKVMWFDRGADDDEFRRFDHQNYGACHAHLQPNLSFVFDPLSAVNADSDDAGVAETFRRRKPESKAKKAAPKKAAAKKAAKPAAKKSAPAKKAVKNSSVRITKNVFHDRSNVSVNVFPDRARYGTPKVMRSLDSCSTLTESITDSVLERAKALIARHAEVKKAKKVQAKKTKKVPAQPTAQTMATPPPAAAQHRQFFLPESVSTISTACSTDSSRTIH